MKGRERLNCSKLTNCRVHNGKIGRERVTHWRGRCSFLNVTEKRTSAECPDASGLMGHLVHRPTNEKLVFSYDDRRFSIAVYCIFSELARFKHHMRKDWFQGQPRGSDTESGKKSCCSRRLHYSLFKFHPGKEVVLRMKKGLIGKSYQGIGSDKLLVAPSVIHRWRWTLSTWLSSSWTAHVELVYHS